MIKQYIIAGIVIAVLFVGWLYGESRYSAGADAVTVAYAESMAAAQEKDRDNVVEVIKWKTKREVVYRDRIQELRATDDPSGCCAVDLSNTCISGMLRTDSD